MSRTQLKSFSRSACVDDKQVFLFAEAMDDDVIDESPLRVEKSGVLRLSDGEARRVVHGDVLDGGEGVGAGEADVAHMADVEDPHAGANRHVLGDDAPADGGRIFDRHVPSVELDHAGPEGAMDGIQRGLADGRRGGDYGQRTFLSGQWLGCRGLELITVSRGSGEHQPLGAGLGL